MGFVGSCVRFAIKTFLVVFVVVFIAIAIHSWLLYKSYIFSQESVADVTLKAITRAKSEGNSSHERIFELVVDELSVVYRGHILPAEKREWIFINCGSWMGSFLVLHASITEYVILFGTGIHTSGNSGRYWANISDTIVEGTFRQWKEGSLESAMYLPGDTVFHSWGEVAGVEWSSGTWMVEYGRGFVPSTLGFALSDTVFGTLDYYNLYKIIRIYLIAMLSEAHTVTTYIIP